MRERRAEEGGRRSVGLYLDTVKCLFGGIPFPPVVMMGSGIVVVTVAVEGWSGKERCLYKGVVLHSFSFRHCIDGNGSL